MFGEELIADEVVTRLQLRGDCRGPFKFVHDKTGTPDSIIHGSRK